MPLLYVNRLASIEDLGLDPDIDGRVKQAIDRELSRQGSNGAFGLWTADSGDDDAWLDAYVTDFLTRARERNFAVPQLAFNSALDQLRNTVVNAPSRARTSRAARLCALRAGAQRPAGHRRSALSLRHQARRLQDAARQGAARRGAGDARRPRARRQGPGAALDALEAEHDTGVSRPDYGSRCATPPPCWRCWPKPI